MNRKQKVAVVVGVVVFELLVLFPPWRAVEGPFESTAHPDWIGRDPLIVWTSQAPDIIMPREPERWNITSKSRFVGRLEIHAGLLVALQVAIILLTVAAVVVLKERKPAS